MATIDTLSSGSSSAGTNSFSFVVDYDTVAQTVGLTCSGEGHARLDLLTNANQPSTTVAQASNGVDVSTFTGNGVLNITSTSGFSPVGGQATVATSAGTATISYITLGTRSLVGVLLISGSGTLSKGGAVTAPQGYIDSVWCDQFGTTSGPVAGAGSTDPLGVPNAGFSSSTVTYGGQRKIIDGPGASGVDITGAALPTGTVSSAVIGAFNVPHGQTPTLGITLSWNP